MRRRRRELEDDFHVVLGRDIARPSSKISSNDASLKLRRFLVKNPAR
jgi:hypothetical protein